LAENLRVCREADWLAPIRRSLAADRLAYRYT
jgi:hypothetical protein